MSTNDAGSNPLFTSTGVVYISASGNTRYEVVRDLGRDTFLVRVSIRTGDDFHVSNDSAHFRGKEITEKLQSGKWFLSNRSYF